MLVLLLSASLAWVLVAVQLGLPSGKASGLEVLRGATSRAEGHFYDAEVHFREASRLNPHNKQAIFSYGLVLQESGEPTAAAAVYRRVLRIDPRFADALLNLGILVAEDDPHRSISLFGRAIKSDRRSATAHFDLGVVLLTIGREREGIAELDRAIRLDPAFKKPRRRAIAGLTGTRAASLAVPAR